MKVKMKKLSKNYYVKNTFYFPLWLTVVVVCCFVNNSKLNANCGVDNINRSVVASPLAVIHIDLAEEFNISTDHTVTIIIPPTRGTVHIENGRFIEYIPNRNFTGTNAGVGVDNFQYQITCAGGLTQTATVNIFIYRTRSAKYKTCPNSTIQMELLPGTGTVSFTWTPISNVTTITPAGAGNIKQVTKDGSNNDGKILVQATWNGITFPADTLTVIVAKHCGTIGPIAGAGVDCEIIRDNESLTPFPPLNASAATVNSWLSTNSQYTSTTGNFNINQNNCLVTFWNAGSAINTIGGGGTGVFCSTAPGRGSDRVLAVQTASSCASNYVFRYPVTRSSSATGCGHIPEDLNETVLFKIYLHSAMSSNARGYNDLLFQIQSDLSNDPEVFYSFRTGNVPNNCQYNGYAIEFVPPEINPYYVTIRNVPFIATGNAMVFFMAEPSITVCKQMPHITTPPTTNPTTHAPIGDCLDRTLQITAKYEDHGWLGGPGKYLRSQWQRCTTGNCSNDDNSLWFNVNFDVNGNNPSETFPRGEIVVYPTIEVCAETDTAMGWYRVLVTNQNVEFDLAANGGCIAISDRFYHGHTQRCIVAVNDTAIVQLGATVTINVKENDIVRTDKSCGSKANATVQLVAANGSFVNTITTSNGGTATVGSAPNYAITYTPPAGEDCGFIEEFQYRLACEGSGLNYYDTATIRISVRCPYILAVQNGRWSDPDTWEHQHRPSQEDSVIIPNGIIVYTGATAQAFGGRAYGQNGATVGGVNGQNETDLTSNLISGNIIKLARSVTIQAGGALVVSQLSDVSGMTNANAAGANNLTNRRLDFGRIINQSTSTVKYTATNSQPEKEVFAWTNPAQWANIKGLLILSSSTDTLGQSVDGVLANEFGITNDGGYVYTHGRFKTANFMNTITPTVRTNAELRIDNGSFFSTGDLYNAYGEFGNSHNLGNTIVTVNGGELVIGGNFTTGLPNNTNAINATFEQKGGRVRALQSVFSRGTARNATTATLSHNKFEISGGKFVLSGNPTVYTVPPRTFPLDIDTRDSLIANTEIRVSASGQLIIDQNRIVRLSSTENLNNGFGIVLDANTTQTADYLNLEALPDVTVENVQGSLAMLKNSELIIFRKSGSGTSTTQQFNGLLNNNPNRNNVYFHRGGHNSSNYWKEDPNNKPSTVVIRGPFHIMPTVPSNPYGILRLLNSSTSVTFGVLDYLNDGDEICIGGRSDKALWYVRTSFRVPHTSNKIVFVDRHSNIHFCNGNHNCGAPDSDTSYHCIFYSVSGHDQISWHGITGDNRDESSIATVGKYYDNPPRTIQILGGTATVERRSTIFGNAIASDIDYYFTGRFTKFRFENDNSALKTFALTTRWRTPPVQTSLADEVDKRSQRYYRVDFDVDEGAGIAHPKIKAFSFSMIGYIDIDPILLTNGDKLMFGVGYEIGRQPLALAKPTTYNFQPTPVGGTGTSGQNWGFGAGYVRGGTSPFTYNFSEDVQTDVILKTGEPNSYTLISGNEIILYLPQPFVSVNNGRWSDPMTWNNGDVPLPEDSVVVRHIVYTGSTSSSFGGRAYGVGGDAIFGGASGANETQLKYNLSEAGDTVKLARVVVIEGLVEGTQYNGALILGQNPSNSGANNLNIPLDFGRIINNSTIDTTSATRANSPDIFGWTTAGQWANLRGLQIMSNAPTVYIKGDHSSTGAYLLNNGFVFVNGNFAIADHHISNGLSLQNSATGNIIIAGGNFPNGEKFIVRGNSYSAGVLALHNGRLEMGELNSGNFYNTGNFVMNAGELHINSLKNYRNFTVNSGTVTNNLGVQNAGVSAIASFIVNDGVLNFGGSSFNANASTAYSGEFIFNGGTTTFNALSNRPPGRILVTSTANNATVTLDTLRNNTDNFTVEVATVAANGTLSITNATYSSGQCSVVVSAGTVNVLGHLISGSSSNSIFTQSSGTINVAKDITVGASSSQFHINGGKFIMHGTPATIIAANPITVNAGQLIIDANKIVNLQGSGSGGLILASSTDVSTSYTAANSGTNITLNNVTGALALLSGAILRIENGAGIINNKTERDNYYFHRGAYNTELPATVGFGGGAAIMPTSETHPYGILEIMANSTVASNLANAINSPVHIGGEADNALNFLRATNMYFGNDNLFLISPNANIHFDVAHSAEIIGKITRKTLITMGNAVFGEATVEKKTYFFNNKHTSLEFDYVSGRLAIPSLWLDVQPNTAPAKVLHGNDQNQYAQRKIIFGYEISATTNPIIRAISIGYRHLTEYSATLAAKDLGFLKGYDAAFAGKTLAMATREGTPANGELVRYFNNNFQVRMLNTGMGSRNEFISGNEILLGEIDFVIRSQRGGRWSDPETWAAGIVPTSDDMVEIMPTHIVYTGIFTGNPLFGGRAWGNPTNSERTESGTYTASGGMKKMAERVTIYQDAGLIFGHNSGTGANVAGDIFEIGSIINNSRPTGLNLPTPTISDTLQIANYLATVEIADSRILNTAYNYSNFRGLHFMENSNRIVFSQTGTVANPTLANNGFMFVNSDVTINGGNSNGNSVTVAADSLGIYLQRGGTFTAQSWANRYQGFAFLDGGKIVISDGFYNALENNSLGFLRITGGELEITATGLFNSGNISQASNNAIGVITLNSGTITTASSVFASNFYNTAGNGSGSGTLNFSGGLLTVADFYNGDGVGKTATVNVNASGGTLTDGILAVQGSFANGVNCNAVLNVLAGTLRVAGDFTNGGGTNTATVNQTGGKVITNQSVTATTSNASNRFDISGGRFIMSGTPATLSNMLTIDGRILVSYSGQFIIDQNRQVDVTATTANGNGGLVLDATTNQVADYAAMETLSFSDINALTVDNVQGSFAMLQGSEFNIHRPSAAITNGLINNNLSRNNLYFHRGKYQNASDKPSLVSYRNSTVMPTVASHPYGNLRLLSTSVTTTYDFGVGNDIYIGGRSDSALFITTQRAIFNSRIIFVDANSNATFSNSFNHIHSSNTGTGNVSSVSGTWDGIVDGTVERRTTIFGNAIATGKNYIFTNRNSSISFNNSGEALENFALTTRWSHNSHTGSPTAYNPPTLVIDAQDRTKRAQRYYRTDFNITSAGTPKITAMSLTFLGQSEISDALFGMREKLLFGAGFDVTRQPARLAKINFPSTANATANQNYGYSATEADITLRNSDVGVTPTSLELVSGNELIMYFGGRFISQRNGRWSNPDTWVYGIVPEKNDTVEIRHIVYTGIWEGSGQDFFGQRPFGAAEDKLPNVLSNGEALLARKVNIVDPSIIPDDDGNFQSGQPSALIIGASVNADAGWSNNPTVMGQAMDFTIPLVFGDVVSNDDDGRANQNGINVMTQGTTFDVAEIMNIARGSNATAWNVLRGLYLLSNPTNSSIVPTIRAININNFGLIFNNAIIEVGK